MAFADKLTGIDVTHLDHLFGNGKTGFTVMKLVAGHEKIIAKARPLQKNLDRLTSRAEPDGALQYGRDRRGRSSLHLTPEDKNGSNPVHFQ